MNQDPSFRHQIDLICDHYEQSLQSGERPDIASVLKEIDESQHADLLPELLALELHYRRLQGETPTREEFTAKFPDRQDVIDAAFAPSATDAAAMNDVTLPPTAPAIEAVAGDDATLPPRAMTVDDATMPPRPAHDDETLAAEAPTGNDASGEQMQTSWKVGGSIRYFGDYELLSEIARGGMGVVYRARQTTLNRIVALKMILAGQLAGEEEVQRFHAEAEAAANLDHPGIVPIYEVGEYEGQHYFSMGFVDGESLSDLISDQPLGPREAAELTMKIADAIGYAHEQGVIHRDLKPANVLVQKRSDGGDSKQSLSTTTISGSTSSVSGLSPRVTDFGLAKQVEGNDQLTASGQILGTPSYMPPEQASGKIEEIDHRSDIYSIGGILYALITGRPPFQAASHLDTLMQVLEKDPVPPRQLDAKLPRDIETIALKALEKDPKRRYQTAGELADDLGRFLSGEPILARSITPIERGWRWARRKPIVAGLGALAASLLLVVSVGGPIAAFQQASLRSLAEQREREATAAKGAAEEAAEMEKAAREDAVAASTALQTEKERAERTLYARTISLAYQAWHNDDVHRAEDLLNKTEHKFRDWEWHFVKNLCNSETKTLRGHSGIPSRMRLTKDGKHLVSAGHPGRLSNDLNVYVWDLESAAVIKTHPYRAFAISPDGKYAAVEMKDDSPVIIMDVMTGEQRTSIPAHGGGTAWANFNSDGTRLVTTGPDSSVRIWDTSSGEKILDIHDQSRRRVHDVNFSVDDRLLVWKTYEGLIQIHDATSGEKLKEIEDRIYRQDAVRVTISPDNRILAAASNGPINLFDLASGKKIASLYGHRSSVLGLAFSPDGHHLASSGVDGTVRVWDVDQRRESFRYRGHKAGVVYGVHEVIYSDDGKWILSGGADKTIKIWPADGGDGFPHDLADKSSDNMDQVQAASVYPDPSQEKDWLVGNLGYVDEVAFSPDGKLVATASEDDTVRVYDLATRENVYTFQGHKQNVAAVAFHPDGKLIASGEGGINDSRNGKILVWDRTTGEVKAKLEGHAGPISGLFFSTDGDRLFSAMGSQAVPHRGEVMGWDLKEQKVLFKYDDLGGVSDFDLTTDGQRLAASSYRGDVYILKTADGTLDRKVGSGQFFATAFSPDGTSLATGKNNWAVTVWDVETGKMKWEQIEHSGAVLGVAFNATGTRLVSTSVDRTTKVWDADSGDMLLDMRGSAFESFGVAVSPDGNTLLSFGEAPYVTLRDLGTDFADRAELASAGQWPVIFSDDFEREELGDNWTTVNGQWAIENGVAKGTIQPLPSVPGLSATTMIPKSWMPSVVEIEYEAWAPKPVLFELKLHDEATKDGAGSLFMGGHIPYFNQGRRGASVIVMASGGFNEVARSAFLPWFEPNKKYKLKTVRHKGHWEMFIDDKPVLEADVPPSMWMPVLHVQGSFANPGSILYVDNVVVRAPESMQDEIAATELEWELRQELKLKSLVINAIESKPDISDAVRKLAIKFAKLQEEDPAKRRVIIRQAVLAGNREPSEYRALIEVLSEDVKLIPDDWRSHQLLAATHYRAADYDVAMKSLREAEREYQRKAGMSHPVNMALLAMTSTAMNQSSRANLAIDRLAELMRSDYWQSDEDAVAWQAEAKKTVTLPEPSDPELAKEIEAIKRLTFEPQQRALCDFQIDGYLANFTDDAVQVDGRSGSPTQYDVQIPIDRWKEAQRVFCMGAASLHARLVRSRADVTINGTEATLHGDYNFAIPIGYWRWQSEEKLRKTDSGWKIHWRRHGITGFQMSGKTFVSKPSDWAKLDAKVEAMRDSADPRRRVQPMVVAHHLREAHDLIKKLASNTDTPPNADLLGGLADRAYSVGDAEEMLRAGTQAVKLKPSLGGPPFLRALAVEEHLPEEPLDVGDGILVRTPSFIPEAPVRDFSVPGKVLRSWYPSDRSALIVFHAAGAFDTGTLEEGMNQIAEQFKTSVKVQIHRKEMTTVSGLEASDLVMEGYGTGRSIGVPQGKPEGTVQRWVVALRGQDLIGFLLTAATNEFDQRNAEFENWLKYVEIDDSTEKANPQQ